MNPHHLAMPYNEWLLLIEDRLRHDLGNSCVAGIGDDVRNAERDYGDIDFRTLVEQAVEDNNEAVCNPSVSLSERARAQTAALWFYRCAKAVQQGMKPQALVCLFSQMLDGAVAAAESTGLGHADRENTQPIIIREAAKARRDRCARQASAGRKAGAGRKRGSSDVEISAAHDAARRGGANRSAAWVYAEAVRIGKLHRADGGLMSADGVRKRLGKIRLD